MLLFDMKFIIQEILWSTIAMWVSLVRFPVQVAYASTLAQFVNPLKAFPDVMYHFDHALTPYLK